jgi:hypothetical protein
MLGRTRTCYGLLVLALCLAAPVRADPQEPAPSPPSPPSDTEPAAEAPALKPRLEWGLEAKANFRRSEANRFPVPFTFQPIELPPGQTRGFEETVNAGSHLELSDVTLFADASWGEAVRAHLKIDFISLYERNPTSSGVKQNVDEAWLRLGRETGHALLSPRSGVYAKIGKFPKFERQNDRHLESYGLVSTAFNRIEDIGLELGADVGSHLYLKGSVTAGNPVFLRDPNALAGDNGQPALLRPNPQPLLQSGIVILYDARVQDLDADGNPQLGLGVGWRTADQEGRNGIDVMAWGRRRKMAQTVEIDGSFYGGDLDLLNGPEDRFPFPVTNDRKREVGANLWLYLGGLSFFAQYVDQDLAGLPRTGIEGEIAWSFDLPLVWSLGERQLFPSIAPALRYSKLDNKFRNPPRTPSPSFGWDWEKIDAGLRLGILGSSDLTLEYAKNEFILGSGAHRNNNEYLATLRWRV